ncbi:tyrosine-type recombinase/integrase [Polycladidibacter hongkongensis]|uniref:tyrosine-type recombinase/integrase n=1 Tax=Polycladidibacter hongkongensis TaxID=1647556 RepID=UPI00082CD5E2|nr:tyrosine-type recombinase/integrase [Pseudovibrio hongkongensis]
MARKRKSGVELPPFVHQVKSKGRTYYYFQPHRGTVKTGDRVRIPHQPQSPAFWSFLQKLQKGQTPSAKTAKRSAKNSVTALIKAYRKHVSFTRLSANSRRDYERYLDLLERRLGEFPASTINTRVMVEIQDSLSDRPSTANHAMSVYRTLFKWGLLRGFNASNPAENIEKIKHETQKARPWPDWAIQLAADHARWEIRTFVYLGLYTGQRTSDILGMRLADIKNDRIRVIQDKTRKELWIPIHNSLQPTIRDCRERGHIYLITRHNGAPLDPGGFRAMFTREMGKPLTSRIRSEGFKPHGLRASAASRLKQIGCSNGQISSITGMSNAMVERYTQQYEQLKTAETAIALWENAEKS